MFGAISDIKKKNNKQNNLLVHCEVHASQLAIHDSELVLVIHQNCLKHNKSFLSNEKKMIETHLAYLFFLPSSM